MQIHNFYILDGSGNCLFSLNNTEKAGILCGFLYSLKSFIQRISPSWSGDNNFFYYTTSNYILVYHEFPTAIKFIMILPLELNRDGEFYREFMATLHKNVYVQYYIRNPINDNISESTLFCDELKSFLQQNF